MATNIIPQGLAFFQGNRRTKRAFGQLEQSKIYASQIVDINLTSQAAAGSAQQKLQGVQQVLMGSKEQFMICLTKVGQIFIWGEFSVPVPLEEGSKASDNSSKKVIYLSPPQHITYFKNVKINQIVCTDTVALFLSNEGTLYAWGDDSESKYGLLGLANQYKAVRPCPNSQLFDYMIKSVSLAETHACAVDSSGRLFCWGYGPNGELGLENQNHQVNVPTIVTKQKQLNIKKAVAHQNYTVFCSGAGYVYLYGSLQPQLGKIQFSTNKGSFGGQTLVPPTQKSLSQINFEALKQSISNMQKPSNNRPLNAMTQIMSLSENFISDVECGDTFIVCMTSAGDMYFVDDALESVQINIVPIDSVAVSGSKILGISNSERIYEWSTAGLNKLSFNKENKLLLRQDFQIKEYKLDSQFAHNAKLCNLNLQRTGVGMLFDDVSGQREKFKHISDLTEDDDLVDIRNDNQIAIAEIVPVKQQNFNPMITDSSVNSSHDQVELRNLIEDGHHQLLAAEGTGEESFQNEEMTPEISIVHNEFLSRADEPLPTFKISNEEQTASQFLNERDSNNVHPYLQGQQNLVNAGHRKTNAINNQNVFQTALNSKNQLFFEGSSNDTVNQHNFAYRPSSIKSYKESNDKSQSSSYNNNSSPSLKQCADQMMPLGRNSKIEISYPSFLNMSSDPREAVGISPEPLSRQQSANVNQQQRLQTPQEEVEIEQQEEPVEERFELQIKFQPCENLNITTYSNKSSSKEASIVKTTRHEEDKVEESMEITIDSIQIMTKRTTTPRRVLNSYSQNKRASEINKSQNSSSQYQQQHYQQTDLKSPHSRQSELSNGFNVTSYSIGNKENQRILDNRFSKIIQGPTLEEEEGLPQVQLVKKVKHSDKFSNSCGTNSKHKKRSFIQAVLQQHHHKEKENHFMIEHNPSSVTQIYKACPLKDDTIIQEPRKTSQQSSNEEEEEYGDEEETSFILQSDKNSEKTQSFVQKQNEQPQRVSQEGQNVYYVYGEQSQANSSQLQPMQIIQLPRYSHIIPNQQDSFFNRESLGPVTQQHTEDNFEVEYTISQSCTPDSKQSSSNIKRRINFDDASGETANGGVIRFSETMNNCSKFLNSFSLNIVKDKQKIQNQKANQFAGDQSQSFIFNQCQSPNIQPFNEENPVSNIKNSNTPSNQASTTHIMMLTEEKFKNLKSEISQQLDPSQYQRTRDNSSPKDLNLVNYTKLDQSKQSLQIGGINSSNHHNLTSFIKHSKYFQVFENYRRGFMMVNKLKDARMAYSLRQIRRFTQDKKQRAEYLQNLVKYLFSVLKGHILQEKAHGFKRVKKFYKERQLQVFIQKKQNEFALKTSVLVKIDQIIISHNQSFVSQGFKAVQEHFQAVKKAQADKKRKSANYLATILQRKSKQVQEKSLRSIMNWANEKKLLQMNLKMTSRILGKVILKHKRKYLHQLMEGIQIREKQKQILTMLSQNILQKAFEKFRQQLQERADVCQKLSCLNTLLEKVQERQHKAQSFQSWNAKVKAIKVLLSLAKQYDHQQSLQLVAQTFKLLKTRTEQIKKREVTLKMNKATLLFLFKRLDEIRKQNMRHGFSSISAMLPREASVMQKSNTQTNLSFHFNGNNEMSMIYRSKASNEMSESDNNEHYRTQQQPPKSQGRSMNTSYQLKNYQSSQMSEHIPIAIDVLKKPKLNDYLSFSPNDLPEGQKQPSNKFFSRRKTEANTGNTLKGVCSNKNEKSYLDCPIPIKDYQERQQKRSNQQSVETLNQLNVSIKDMNKAFRDQISRIKERQDENEVSSFQNVTHYEQSFDRQNKMMLLDIELSQTPDHLNQEVMDDYKNKTTNLINHRNRSPTTINPLCTSESYCMLKGFMSNQSVNPLEKLLHPTAKGGQVHFYGNNTAGVPICQNDIRLDNKIDEFTQEYNTAPKTSTFGGQQQTIGLGSENIEPDNSEAKFNNINKTSQAPMIFRTNDLDNNAAESPHQNSGRNGFSSTMNRKKSDQRYQLRESNLDQDYALEFEQEKDIFDEFLNREGRETFSRKPSMIGVQMPQTSLADISRKVNLSQCSKLTSQQEPVQEANDNEMKRSTASIVAAAQAFKQQKQVKQLLISPHYTDESFIPQAINRELLNEMAANYHMMELTPDATDYKMLANNKSLFNRQEESIYSNNQYADPMEMAISPRATIADVSSINHPTNQTQVNYYALTQETGENQPQSDCEDEYGDEIDQIMQHSEHRPYDFELSSNSKYKIISQNQEAKAVLAAESAQPSKMQVSVSATNICKKLSFGYDLAKKNYKVENTKQRSTLLINSNGEQTINFNLTQEEESENEADYDVDRVQEESFEDSDGKANQTHSDEELEVGEEKPAEYTQKLALGLPESRILQQELQEEKLNQTLSSQDLILITQNRIQKLGNQSINSSNEYTFQQQRTSQQSSSDFITQNIQKLRNIVRLSPRYQGQAQHSGPQQNHKEIMSKLSSANQSTRNLHQKKIGLFSSKANTYSSYENPMLQTQQVSRQSANQPHQPSVYKSFAFTNTSNFLQGERSSKPSSHKVTATQSQRSYSKENARPMPTTTGPQPVRITIHPQLVQQTHQYQPQIPTKTLREKSNNNLRRSGTSYQPLTFRAPSAGITGNQSNNTGSFGGQNYSVNLSGIMNNQMFDRRVSYQEQFDSTQPMFRNTSNTGSLSQRGATNGSFQKSRNNQSDKLQTFLQIGSKVMNNVSAAQMNYSLTHNNSMTK